MTKRNKNSKSYFQAFTIVELLVVIIVIAILTAISIVAYTNISANATKSAMKADLAQAYKSIVNFQTLNDHYPTTIDCSQANSTTNLCISTANNITLSYSVDNTTPQSFTLYAKSTNLSSNVTYEISNNTTTPTQTTNNKTCPNNFILVPGSTTYGTSDFCVAKYEMKIYGNDNGNQTYSSTFVPQSRASGTPWVNISQTNAIAEAPTTVDGQGNTISSSAHLITEAEWMTIAQNVLQQTQNWSTGTVGSGFIYTGHSNNNPASALAADSNDANSLYGMTSTGTTVGSNVKRTLTLSNGEVIWDMSGNVYEWTSGQTTGSQPGLTTDATYVWRDWKNATVQNGFPSSSMPSSMASGSLANITSWTMSNGIGGLASYYGETALRGFFRGGTWNSGSYAGVLYLYLAVSPSGTNSLIGFRVVVPAS